MGFKLFEIFISIVLIVFLFLKLDFSLTFLIFCIYFCLLVRLSFYDLQYKAVPDYLLLILLFFSFFISDFSFYDSLVNSFIASGAMFLLNFIVTFYIQNIKSRIIKNKDLKFQHALGDGDIPVIASMSVILGLNSIVYAILISAFIALIYFIIISFYQKINEIPFIPFLSAGFFIEYFLGLHTVLRFL